MKDRSGFLKALKSDSIPLQVRAGWFISRCPLAPWRHDNGVDKNPSFAIKDEPGDAFCNCFSCGFAGSQSDLVLTMRMLNQGSNVGKFEFGKALALIEEEPEDTGIIDDSVPDIEEILLSKNKVHIFSEEWLGSFPSAGQIAWAKDYLIDRGVGLVAADYFDIRADTSQKRVCFPVYDFQHRLRGLHGRAVSSDTNPRYRMYTYKGQNSQIVWLGEKWVDLDKPIVVVEGPFDLASVWRVYRNVVSPLFASPSSKKIKRMADAEHWVTFFDRGMAGDKGRRRIEMSLPNHIVEHALPPSKELDPGALDVGQVENILSKFVPLDTFIVA